MDAETDELVRVFVADGGRLRDWRGVYSVAPTGSVPVVHEQDGGRVLELARWDWEKPPRMPPGRPLINARVEKMMTPGMWVGPFSSSRCIVPMRGYYEWTTDGKAKIPHFLHGGGLLAAAGLTWHMRHQDQDVRCFVVITREARDASGQVHDRMPAFLTEDLYDQWLDPESLTIKGDVAASRAGRQQLVDALMHASDTIAATIREHVVDRRISNTRTVDRYDPGLIQPA